MKHKNRPTPNVPNKNDNSLRVSQREKIDTELKIRPFPWTEKQQKFIDLALKKEISVVLCRAPAGVGKTLLSLYCCLELLNKKSISSILFYRCPVESCSHSIGFLAGQASDKLAPYGEPLFDHLKELLDKSTVNYLIKDERILIDSIGFAKGRTFHTTGVILEEAEDLTIQELELIMGRMGRFSKLFIIGDVRQSNIRNSGFSKVFDLFNNPESLANGIVCQEFLSSDCMRSPILKFILDKFDKLNNK